MADREGRRDEEDAHPCESLWLHDGFTPSGRFPPEMVG